MHCYSGAFRVRRVALAAGSAVALATGRAVALAAERVVALVVERVAALAVGRVVTLAAGRVVALIAGRAVDVIFFGLGDTLLGFFGAAGFAVSTWLLILTLLCFLGCFNSRL